jgi:hypothetical protein
VPWNGRPKQQVFVAHNRIAQHAGIATGEPERQIAIGALLQNQRDIRIVRVDVRVDGVAILSLHVGTDGEVMLIRAADPDAHRPHAPLAFPELGRERPHGALVFDNDDCDWPIEIRAHPRRERDNSTANLFELPRERASARLAGI